jgi:hypothetical protein
MIDDFMASGRGEIAARFYSKARLLAVRLSAVPGFQWVPHSRVDIRDVLGMPSVSEDWGPFLDAHLKSLMAYVPRPYPGRVDLFRARTLPLSRLHERDLGWGRMALGGATVTIVPGSHENILQEPQVRILADRLRRSFDEADKRGGNLSCVS